MSVFTPAVHTFTPNCKEACINTDVNVMEPDGGTASE